MSVIPARRLTPHDLAQLGHNTAAAAKAERDVCRAAYIPAAGDEPVAPEPVESDVDKAIRSEHVAA